MRQTESTQLRVEGRPIACASILSFSTPLSSLCTRWQCFRDVSDGFLYLVKGCILFVPSGGSNLLALCTRWLGSVSFARSPTGRSFSMTVEVDSERADSEKVGELAAADASYTFNEMDIADEASVNECVCRIASFRCLQATFTSTCGAPHYAHVCVGSECAACCVCTVVMSRPI